MYSIYFCALYCQSSLGSLFLCFPSDCLAINVDTMLIPRRLSSLSWSHASRANFLVYGSYTVFLSYSFWVIKISLKSLIFSFAMCRLSSWLWIIFFVTSHSENACDGIGWTVKCAVYCTSLQRHVNDQILSARHILRTERQNVLFMFFKDEINIAAGDLVERFGNGKF